MLLVASNHDVVKWLYTRDDDVAPLCGFHGYGLLHRFRSLLSTFVAESKSASDVQMTLKRFSA